MPLAIAKKKTLRRAPPAAADGAKQKAYPSRNESVYQEIRLAIERGDLQPGQRVMELEIADWLAVSRTPVREALRRLETEGMLEIEPRIGLVVASLSRQAVMELYAMRELLEVTAAGWCAVHATNLEVTELEELVRREQRLQGDADELVRHNRRFHSAVHRGAHNRYLTKSLNAVNDSMWLLGPSQMRLAHRAKAALTEHAELCAAIQHRDPVAAQAAARRHVQAAQTERLKTLFTDYVGVAEKD
jgi:DNA-binding GntR family transcriptional regulator